MARGAWAWRVFLGFTIIMLSILTGLVAFLAQVRYRVADAEAQKKAAEARRALLVSIDQHTVLDLLDNSIRTTTFAQTPTVIPPPFAAPVPQNVRTDGAWRSSSSKPRRLSAGTATRCRAGSVGKRRATR